MKLLLKSLLSLLFTFIFTVPMLAQGYLHAGGKLIYDGAGNEVILRGIGTGNWLLQEGYMMKTSNFAGTQHEIRQKMIETIGLENTNTFYNTWLNNHFTRTDVDSMKAWGFNSVRVAMHYKWFTLPIEEEPVQGQDTWLEDGFVRIDSLLDWCGDNQMYLILDLHGAPGGQGHDANISDYDNTKPSLWESAENRRKTVALWSRLACRYSTEPWMGGYDLINEPNWELPGGTLLKQLYQQITTAIRAVDPNHMIIIEGNWFANDYTGLLSPWDNNMVYSFHKYWSYNNTASLDWIKAIRNNQNVPVWLGESGENSNSWFTDLIALCESNHIGWSWWPVKKDGINNVLKVPSSRNYDDLISYWETGSPAMTTEQAFTAVMDWAENHRIQNCDVRQDVIDAMIRQPFTTSTIPFRVYHTGEPVHAVNYDLGRSSFAYWDADSANYHLNTNTYVDWNKGWEYRNDGVDIEKCTDINTGNNGYNVGFINDGEWMQYTLQSDTAAAYVVHMRSATAGFPGIAHLQIDGVDASPPHTLPVTGGWQVWNTSVINQVILPAGTHKVRVYFDRGGSNFSYFSFTNPTPVENVPFSFLSAGTSIDGTQIFVTLNKDVSIPDPVPADFQVVVAGVAASVTSVTLNPAVSRGLILTIQPAIRFQQVVKISYNGTSVLSGEDQLVAFSDKDVKNNLLPRFNIPNRIQAEAFYFNNGFQLENCTDTGGGQNTGFANPGDYLDYLIYVPQAGEYTLNIRYATQSTNGRMDVRTGSGSTFTSLGTVNFSSTGGWQTWRNHQISVTLPQGDQVLRLYALSGEFNINWFEIVVPNSIKDQKLNNSLKVYPNPGDGRMKVSAVLDKTSKIRIMVSDMFNKALLFSEFNAGLEFEEDIDLSGLGKGMYLLKISSDSGTVCRKVVIL
ncbi:MAG: glycoside hydrolase family protein [Bacteroidetes bacterium]|nr:MAG: glycoside hydrolase family protein [Bacteroidota bacterium]